MTKTTRGSLWSLAVLGGLGVVACEPAPEEPHAVAPGRAMVDSMGQELGAISRRVVEANRSQDHELTLRARLEVQPNELLEFYEPVPGVILMSGAGAPSAPSRIARMIDSGASSEAIWAAASGGLAMPQPLVLALERRNARLPKAGAASLASAPRGLGASSADLPLPAAPAAPVHQQSNWCDTGFFQTGYQSCYLDFKLCKDNWWNGIYAYHNDTLWGRATVCAATGEMVLHTQSDDDAWPTQSFTVPQETYRWRSISDGACRYPGNDCPFFRAEVLAASGKRFHFRFLVDEE